MKTLETLIEELERQYAEDDFELSVEILYTIADYLEENLSYHATARDLVKAFTRIVGPRKVKS